MVKKCFKVCIITFICVLPVLLLGDIFYLKDGQVINGKMIKETRTHLFIKTAFTTYRVKRTNIKRIKSESRKMELFYIQMKDEQIIKGYLVDQDATKLYIKDTPASTKEKIILKKDVKQFSQSEIKPIYPFVLIRSGYYLLLNSKKSQLKNAPCYYLGGGVNIPWVQNAKFIIEGGYIRSESKKFNKMYLQLIPITMQFLYNMQFKYFAVNYRTGAGGVIIDYNDGKDLEQRGLSMIGTAGIHIERTLWSKHLFVNAGFEYNYITEFKAALHTIAFTGSFVYRF